MAKDAEADPARRETTFARGRKVLIGDDNADAAEGIAMLLGIAGHEVKVVTDSMQAMSSVEVFAPHVAILDIGLPIINGYDLARRMRAQAAGAQLLLIALTGYAQKEDRELAAKAGFDYHFVKPVDSAELEAAINAGRKPVKLPKSGAGEIRSSY